MIREVREDEYEQLMSLFCQLHETNVPEYSAKPKNCGIGLCVIQIITLL